MSQKTININKDIFLPGIFNHNFCTVKNVIDCDFSSVLSHRFRTSNKTNQRLGLIFLSEQNGYKIDMDLSTFLAHQFLQIMWTFPIQATDSFSNFHRIAYSTSEWSIHSSDKDNCFNTEAWTRSNQRLSQSMCTLLCCSKSSLATLHIQY